MASHCNKTPAGSSNRRGGIIAAKGKLLPLLPVFTREKRGRSSKKAVPSNGNNNRFIPRQIPNGLRFLELNLRPHQPVTAEKDPVTNPHGNELRTRPHHRFESQIVLPVAFSPIETIAASQDHSETRAKLEPDLTAYGDKYSVAPHHVAQPVTGAGVARSPLDAIRAGDHGAASPDRHRHPVTRRRRIELVTLR